MHRFGVDCHYGHICKCNVHRAGVPKDHSWNARLHPHQQQARHCGVQNSSWTQKVDPRSSSDLSYDDYVNNVNYVNYVNNNS